MKIKNIHAGISDNDIVKFMEDEIMDKAKILKEEEDQKDGSNFNKTSKYSSTGFKGNKTEGYLIKQTGKINKLINNYKRRNNLSGNNNSNNLSENFKQLSIKGINNS